MQALFVHGMGRSPLSGWPLMARLRAQGIRTHALGYATPFQSFAAIRARLVRRIQALSAHGDYVLIGHSLGGVLLRAAVAALPPSTPPPRHLFLLGSPIQASRFAQNLQRNWLFRLLAGDCGQLLASPARMALIGPVNAPTTSVAGTRGWKGRLNPFEGELNDGIVSLTEIRADWITEEICLPVIHTYLPSNKQVSEIIQARLANLYVSA